MLPQQRKGWTTVTDIEEFKKITWSYLTNVKMTWEYQGMANLFRKANIPIYGKDLGTLKMNHPILTMAIPQHKDKNYGVDIYVPASKKAKAEKLIADPERIKEAAELEETEGQAAYDSFNKEAQANKERNARIKKEARQEKVRGIAAAVIPGFVASKE